ncbi:MAG: SufE family protein [Rhodothermales bacterium]
MTEIQDRARALVDEFAMFDDWMDKYQYLIDLGASVPAIEDAFRTDTYRIQGCQAQVWLHAEPHGQRIHFTADSDAQITRGLIAALLRVLNDQPAESVAAADLSFLDEIGMKEHLSPTRKNGLDSMIKQIRLYAAAIAASQSE